MFDYFTMPVEVGERKLVFKMPGDAPWPGPDYRSKDIEEVNEALFTCEKAKREDLMKFMKGRLYDGRYARTPKAWKKEGWKYEREESISLEMVQDFANLHIASDFPSAALRFAREWGPLWECSAHSFCLYSPESVTEERLIGIPPPFTYTVILPNTPKEEGKVDYGRERSFHQGRAQILSDEIENLRFTPCRWEGKETLESWRLESSIVYGELNIIECLTTLGYKETARRWNKKVSFLKNRFSFSLPPFSAATYASLVNDRNRSPFGPSLFLEEDEDAPDKRPRLVSYAGMGFIRAIYLHLAARIAGADKGQHIFTCSACGDILFRKGSGVLEGQKVYCKKDECRKVKNARATRDFRSRKPPE